MEGATAAGRNVTPCTRGSPSHRCLDITGNFFHPRTGSQVGGRRRSLGGATPIPAHPRGPSECRCFAGSQLHGKPVQCHQACLSATSPRTRWAAGVGSWPSQDKMLWRLPFKEQGEAHQRRTAELSPASQAGHFEERCCVTTNMGERPINCHCTRHTACGHPDKFLNNNNKKSLYCDDTGVKTSKSL